MTKKPPRPSPQQQRADAALILQALTTTGPIPTATVAARLGLTRLEARALLLCMEGAGTEGEFSPGPIRVDGGWQWVS